jgi:hypothetical protein
MGERTTNAKTNIAILMEEMKQEVYGSLLFAPFMGTVKTKYEAVDSSDAYAKQILMSGNIVENFEDWSSKTKGRWADSIEYPMRKRLTQKPFYGDAWISGTGEDLDYRWGKCFINVMSETVMLKRGEMDELRDEDIYDLLEGSREESLVWWARNLNAEAVASVYEGASMNITAGINNSPNGIGLKKVLHPNTYYLATTGMVAIGTEYYSKTFANMTGINFSSVTKLTADGLFRIKMKLRKMLIRPAVSYKGRKLWLYVIGDEDLYNLMTETTFANTVKQAQEGFGFENNYIMSPDAWVFGDFMLVANSNAVRKWHNTYGYAGANGYVEDPTTDDTDHNATYILGGQSLLFGVEKKINFIQDVERTNHGGVKELAVKHCCGWARMEWVDESALSTVYSKSNALEGYMDTATYIYNKSSVVIITLV